MENTFGMTMTKGTRNDWYRCYIPLIENQNAPSARLQFLTMFSQTQESGQNTLTMLDGQGEQLQRVEANLDTINSEVAWLNS